MYTVYRTTNIVNSKFYIGVHKTDNPMDGYLGSGKMISRAIKKYGVENFRKEILGVFEDSRDAFALEAQLVTKEVVESPLCYNIKLGGEGGFDFINTNGLNGDFETRSQAGKKGWMACHQKKVGIFDPNRDRSNPNKKVSDKELLEAFRATGGKRSALRMVGLAEQGGGMRRLNRLIG